MGKRGPKSKAEKEEAKKIADGTEPAVEPEVGTPPPPSIDEANPPEIIEAQPEQNIAATDCYRYHNDHEPKIFKKGGVIPDGWIEDQTSLAVVWTHDDYGKWAKKLK